ncbi:xylulokinase [Chloropicon primus]|uniref:Xylulokinase n=2 Tax=Chloropicon primus TaxID=1764295 RepID=A0A5B8MV97_9CHLO|nr:xylulokinase [Chloropicon primus]UPR03414.1 xylulokinase [Chloropicon primus]|eukprot:QDZ24206.1 xylulokinase [Chloropicon primus]
MLYLGVDIGTQGAKAVVFDLKAKRVVARGAKQYGLLTGRPGLAEQDPKDWISGGRSAIQDAVSGLQDEERERICAIGVSGQQHGLVVLDENKEVVRPAKLWCDTESSREAEELGEALGWKLGPAFTGTKVMWLKRNEPENWQRVRHVLMPKDYFNYWLTGEIATEASDQSGSAFFDPVNKTWDERALEFIGLPAAYLPKLVAPIEKVGTIREAVAEALRLPASVVVSPGGGDNACSALAAGAVADGTMVMSLGTSGTLFGYSSKPVLDKTGMICPFCDATGAYLPLVCTLNCTEVPEDVRAMIDEKVTREELTKLASEVPAGCSGVSYIPYLRGERTPNLPGAAGAIVGLRYGMLKNAGLLYRAAIEGVTFSLLAGVNAMKNFGVSDLKELRVVGGGAANALWCQIIASSFGVPVKLIEESETAALGAALQAGAVHGGEGDIARFVSEHGPPTGGTIQPESKDARLYGEAYERHLAVGGRLFG